MSTFYRIYPNHREIPIRYSVDARTWADRNWDTYGFDYDLEQTDDYMVLAWATNSDKELSDNLKGDGIRFTTFEGDPEFVIGY